MQTTLRPLIIYPEESAALARGATVLCVLDRPGIVPPVVGEQLLCYVGKPEDGKPYEVTSVRETTFDGMTDQEKTAAKAVDERFIAWLVRMMGRVLWSDVTKIYATTVREVLP